MLFTNDTEASLSAAVELVNSAEHPDTLTSTTELDAFLTTHAYTGRVDHDGGELAAVRALRARLRTMLLAPRDEMVAHVNDALADVPLNARLIRHGEVDWHLHAIGDDRPLPERILIETAMALIDVVRTHEDSRLRVCADADCDAIVLDLSRNRSKRYCSTTCTNRNAVAAYRARRATG
ncbi:CGNR zinc finger domain-containing protein [Microbacterium sp. NPDC056234]|uniref:CGNR zinc finger domain-containing protein n=1 Tax=Microbacterium sp. NPDC056234 TaxID=3345757 RepID=UPI0035DEE03D